MYPHLLMLLIISLVSSFRIPPPKSRSTTIRYYYPVRDKAKVSLTTTSQPEVVNLDQFEVLDNVLNSLESGEESGEESSDILIQDDEYVEYVFDLKDLLMTRSNGTSSSTFQSPSKSLRTSDQTTVKTKINTTTSTTTNKDTTTTGNNDKQQEEEQRQQGQE